METEIPFIDFGGDGQVIHLAHANGFPSGCYAELAEQLTANYKVIGMNARPLWPNSDHRKLGSWRTMADDLIRFLDERKLINIIGIGHSFGSIITIIAANKRPGLFKKLILIEPVVLSKKLLIGTSIVPSSVIKRVVPIAKVALSRTDVWESRKEAFSHFRVKPVFAKITDNVLWDYVNSGTEIREDGKAHLSYSKEWEAQIFSTVADPWNELKNLKTPFLAIRGANSDVLTPKVRDKWKNLTDVGSFVEMEDTGHLVPFEKPRSVAEHILGFLT